MQQLVKSNIARNTINVNILCTMKKPNHVTLKQGTLSQLGYPHQVTYSAQNFVQVCAINVKIIAYG